MSSIFLICGGGIIACIIRLHGMKLFCCLKNLVKDAVVVKKILFCKMERVKDKKLK